MNAYKAYHILLTLQTHQGNKTMIETVIINTLWGTTTL